MATAFKRSESLPSGVTLSKKSTAIDIETFQHRQELRDQMRLQLRRSLDKETLQTALMFQLQRKMVHEQKPAPGRLVRGSRMRRHYRHEARKILKHKDKKEVEEVEAQLRKVRAPTRQGVAEHPGPSKLLDIQTPLVDKTVRKLKKRLLLSMPSQTSLHFPGASFPSLHRSKSMASSASHSSSSSISSISSCSSSQSSNASDRSLAGPCRASSSLAKESTRLHHSQSTAVFHRSKERLRGTNLHRHMAKRFACQFRVLPDLSELEKDLRRRIDDEFGEFGDDMIVWTFFDKENKGLISFNQFTTATSELGMELEPHAAKMLFFRYDSLGTGKIGLRDFICRLMGRSEFFAKHEQS